MTRKSFSLRTQLIVLMALLVLLQSLSLLVSLVVSSVFFKLDAESFRLFNSTTATRVGNYNSIVGSMVVSFSKETSNLSSKLTELAAEYDTSPQEIYLNDELYTRSAIEGTEALLSFLRNSTVSGVFFMFGGSNADKGSAEHRSCVYIRNSAPGNVSEGVGSFLMEFGPIAVSKEYGIATSVGLDLHVRVAPGTDEFYTQPSDAARLDPGAEMERYGYWNPPADLFGDKQSDVCYTMPLLDREGKPYGIAGFEISIPLFNQYYLPSSDLPYQNSFYIIAPVRDGSIELEWFIPSGPIAQVYLKNQTLLPVEKVTGSDVFDTSINELGDMYCAVQPIEMYSRNSSFYDESWSLISFVPKHILHGTSGEVRDNLMASIAATTAIAFVAIFMLAYATTRKISALSRYMKGLSPYTDISFNPTNIREIDELTSAVESLNKSVINASKTTSKILGLTLLPIGGFEISQENSHVILTEYIYTLLDIPPGAPVTRERWKDIYQELTQDPALGYDDIYRYGPDDEKGRWIRILEAETETGKVGVILDVTKDIEENRRLAHELDYDALTRLLNRTAFKREAYLLIQSDPGSIGVMIFADLDNLKYTNDTFGHDVGDRLIMRAGEMFRSFERHGGVVSRISGDEFAIYLHGFTSREEALKLIYGQYDANESYSLDTPDGSSQKIRSSSGLAFYPDDSDNVTDLLKLADFAMYEAKHNRKGSIYEFSVETYRNKSYLLENREAINRLIDEGLIRFAFQPLVSLETGEIFAYEALMRPLLDNFKSPLEILSVAATQSKLSQLEQLVMMTAFKFVNDHLNDLGSKKIFINSIPSQTLTDEDHAALKREFSRAFGNIVIEITEAENDSPLHLKNKLSFLRENRIGVALDDFGSGYSNEIRILSINPDIVKVDIELISNIDTDQDKQKLVSNLISFCRTKGIKLVAEGVETRGELARLISLGVDYVQGYYIARPQFSLDPLPEKVTKEILYLRGAGEPGEFE